MSEVLREPNGESRPKNKSEAAIRLIFFENYFFRLDSDGDGFLTVRELERMLAFTAHHLTLVQCQKALFEADTQSDGKLNRAEFVQLCVKTLWSMPFHQLEMAASSFVEYRASLSNRQNRKWRRIANRIDRYSRLLIPLFYFILLGILFGVRVTDPYIGKMIDDDGNLAFALMGSYMAVQLKSLSLLWLLALLVIAAVLGVAWRAHKIQSQQLRYMLRKGH